MYIYANAAFMNGPRHPSLDTRLGLAEYILIICSNNTLNKFAFCLRSKWTVARKINSM